MKFENSQQLLQVILNPPLSSICDGFLKFHMSAYHLALIVVVPKDEPSKAQA